MCDGEVIGRGMNDTNRSLNVSSSFSLLLILIQERFFLLSNLYQKNSRLCGTLSLSLSLSSDNDALSYIPP